MAWTALDRYRDLGLLIVRLGFGLGFLFWHGWGKLVGGPERWHGTGQAVSHLGINFGYTFWGFMAAFAESVGGLLFALGLFFRFASFLIFFTMFVAVAFHLGRGDGWDGAKHAFKNASVALGFIFVGPGTYSLDALIRRRRSRASA